MPLVQKSTATNVNGILANQLGQNITRIYVHQKTKSGLELRILWKKDICHLPVVHYNDEILI